MTRSRQALGRDGERCAARWLEARGYQIVARNVRADRVEIDLVALDGRRLVFVEVKTRRASGRDGFGHHAAAAEAVDERKQRRLRRGAMAWLATQPTLRRRALGVRFDVMTCLLESRDARARADERWSIEHWRGAF